MKLLFLAAIYWYVPATAAVILIALSMTFGGYYYPAAWVASIAAGVVGVIRLILTGANVQ